MSLLGRISKQKRWANTDKPKIHELMQIDGAERIVNQIVFKLFNTLSMVLSPSMPENTKITLIDTAIGNFYRNYSKQITLTGLIHMIDLIISKQPPFDKELFKFDVRAIGGFIQDYKKEQVRRQNLVEQKPLGARQRQYLLAKAMASNPVIEAQFKALAEKLEEKHTPEYARTDGKPKYCNLYDYVARNSLPESILSRLAAYWEGKHQHPDEMALYLLDDLNAGNTDTILHQLLNEN